MVKVSQSSGELAQYNNDWLVTNVHFGLPLFDAMLNRAARDAITTNKMFSGLKGYNIHNLAAQWFKGYNMHKQAVRWFERV